jgi:hypothetical protein
MTNPLPASEDSRLDRLEKKEVFLESELGRLDKEEKDLERRLTELELKEIELAKSVSRLTQVKARRPEFLMNYMKSSKKRAVEAAAAPIPSPAPAAAQPAAQTTPPQPVVPTQPRPAVAEKPPAQAQQPAPMAPATPQPAAPIQPKPETKPDASSQPAAASAQTLLPPHIEEVDQPEAPKSKLEEKNERKQILEAQIKNVLKKQELKKKEEQEKQEVLDAKTPVHKMNLDGKMSESAGLFKLLLSKGSMTLEEAGRMMKADKDTMNKAAKDLEDSGLIEVNRPLYGSPKIRLKSLTEGMEKPIEKK